jgi:hypothetical protein
MEAVLRSETSVNFYTPEYTTLHSYRFENFHLILCRICGPHTGGYEEFYLLGYNAMLSVESQLIFRYAFYLFHAGLLLDLFFDSEDGGDIFLRNVI